MRTFMTIKTILLHQLLSHVVDNLVKQHMVEGGSPASGAIAHVSIWHRVKLLPLLFFLAQPLHPQQRFAVRRWHVVVPQRTAASPVGASRGGLRDG